MFGRRLKQLRIEKRMSQEELADVFGYYKSTISMWENGARVPGHDILKDIAKYFNVTTDYLLGNDELSITVESVVPDKELAETIIKLLEKKDAELFIKKGAKLSNKQLNSLISMIDLLTEEKEEK